MTLFLLLSIASTLGLGFGLTFCVWPSRPAPGLLLTLLAWPVGVASTSVLYFLWLILSGGDSSWYPVAETAVLTALVCPVIRARRSSKPDRPALFWRPQISGSATFLTVALVVAAALCFTTSAKLTRINPWGYWDAWARINVKARFLAFGGGHWTWIFESSRIAHHDYPLLLPCSVARTWVWMGGVAALAPQVLSVAWGAWSVAALYGVAAWLRGPMTAVILSLAYLTFTPLLLWSAGQYADIPLACYMVLACAMTAAAKELPEGGARYGLLAGYFAGSAAWCKNEGIAFLLLITLWWLILQLRRPCSGRLRLTGFFLAGAGLAASPTLILKGIYAGRSGLLLAYASSTQSAYGALADSVRHQTVLEFLRVGLSRYWCGWSFTLSALALFVQSLWFRRPRLVHVGTLACSVGLCAVYYLVLVTTPSDLNWQLVTALDRLLLQVWPLFLLGLGLLTAGGELSLLGPDSASHETGASRHPSDRTEIA